MKVSDLQTHFAELARFLETAGASGVAKDLNRVRDCLAPFCEASVTEFADFLVRADAYSRGEVPLRKGAAKATGSKAAQGPDVTVLAEQARSLYEQAASTLVTGDHIDALVAQLQKLTKDGLVVVAAATGLKVTKSTKKDDVVQAIHQRIIARKGSFQRTGLIDRPTAAVPG